MEIRRKSLAVLLGISIAGIVGASAASLNLTSSNVGATVQVVSSCHNDPTPITVRYTTAYSAANQRYEVSAVQLQGVDTDCAGQTISVTLSDGASALGSGTTVAVGGNNTVSITPNVSAEALTRIAVIIAS